MVEKWSLKRTKQCEKCPWKVEVDPFDIPNGYTIERHRNLIKTTVECGIEAVKKDTIDVMSCHESNNDEYCVGWLKNQLGIGNNIVMRLKMMSCANGRDIQTFGEQHERFEDTLPD